MQRSGGVQRRSSAIVLLLVDDYADSSGWVREHRVVDAEDR
jgi:hypothetical protein